MRAGIKLIKPRPDPQWAFEPEPDELILDICDLKRFGARMIHGLATSSTPNSHRYSLAAEGCRYTLPIPLLAGHGRRKDREGKTIELARGELHSARVGEIVWLARTSRGIFIRALLDQGYGPDLAWEKLQRGGYKGLSAAADWTKPFRRKSIVDGIAFYDQWTLGEISIVETCANPDATCTIFVPSVSRERQ